MDTNELIAKRVEGEMGLAWQPIESAPKDGMTSILACQRFGDGHHRILTMIWSEKAGQWCADVHSFIAFEPTHWMPLPAPPELKTA